MFKDSTLFVILDYVFIAGFCKASKLLLMLGLYVGAVAFIYCAYSYDPPEEIRVRRGELPPVMPAVAYTF